MQTVSRGSTADAAGEDRIESVRVVRFAVLPVDGRFRGQVAVAERHQREQDLGGVATQLGEVDSKRVGRTW